MNDERLIGIAGQGRHIPVTLLSAMQSMAYPHGYSGYRRREQAPVKKRANEDKKAKRKTRQASKRKNR